MCYPEIERYQNDPSYENQQELLEAIGQERFKVSEIGVSTRVFANWKQHGVLPDYKEGKWIRFNLIEFFWMQVVKDLRSLGVSLKTIAFVKYQLYEGYNASHILLDEDDNVKHDVLEQICNQLKLNVNEAIEFLNDLKEMSPNFRSSLAAIRLPVFMGIVLETVFRRSEFKLVVHEDGQIGVMCNPQNEMELPYFTNDLDEYLNNTGNQAVIVLPLKKYMYMLSTLPQHETKAIRFGLLNEVEQEVIQSMRAGNLKELTIQFDPKNNYTDLVYKYQKSIEQKDINHIIDTFRERKHVALSMKSNDGKSVQYVYQDRRRFKNV